MTTTELAWRIRRDSLEMAHISKGAHIGSCLSVTDILAVLYNDVMRIFPDDPENPDRDRFILSKGHGGTALYAVLAEKGFFPMQELKTQRQNGSKLSGLTSYWRVPGVEFSTGSLGMGISVGTGMAMAAKRSGGRHRVYVVLGDGECGEGSVWEAAMFAGHNQLSNLTVVVDNNNLQANDSCENVLSWKNIRKMWESFGWHVLEVNGHDLDALKIALSFVDGIRPVCVIAHTIKGKGISFMENQKIWHYRSPQGEEYLRAVEELEESRP